MGAIIPLNDGVCRGDARLSGPTAVAGVAARRWWDRASPARISAVPGAAIAGTGPRRWCAARPSLQRRILRFFDRADNVRASHNIALDNDGAAIDFALQLNILPLTLATLEVWERERLV